jgi:hypothetical protein
VSGFQKCHKLLILIKSCQMAMAFGPRISPRSIKPAIRLTGTGAAIGLVNSRSLAHRRCAGVDGHLIDSQFWVTPEGRGWDCNAL